ncbi:ABC-type dipeptide transport system, ATPase component [Thermococcus sibiricus MM 739]|uniref:ABC-type dipeptide transport system, ATPase component n=1 Tax=Thermococcus sibiricus (strain DSM 12597 / MM 739) TaxID=604354 RepID=C6A2Y6_THESM|nr:ABC-type dipeptide transport system, ATPase component [Thermococcus sibiricus MM 739]
MDILDGNDIHLVDLLGLVVLQRFFSLFAFSSAASSGSGIGIAESRN